MQSLLTTLALSLAFLTSVSANPSGSPVCTGGATSVGGNHLDFGPGSPSGRVGSSGSLSDGATVVTIGGTILVPETPATFAAGTDLVWSVEAFQVAYKGILIRIGADDANTFTMTSNNADVVASTVCDAEAGNVLGFVHNSAAERTLVSGVLRFDGSGPVTIDVNVVFANGRVAPNDVSLYAYSAFSATVEAAAAPVDVPVEAPVEVPVDAPVEVPVDAPVEVPVDTPVETPVPGGETPAPGVETPAPGVETPAPGVETPAPGVETPAPGVETPAPGVETPAPGVETPAPGVETPAPGVETPVPGAETPAPDVVGGDEDECEEDEGKGKGKKGEGKGKGGKGDDTEGKGKGGDTEGKGKGGKKGKKGKKCKKAKKAKTPKAGGSEKKEGKGKGGKGGDSEGKGSSDGKGDVRYRK